MTKWCCLSAVLLLSPPLLLCALVDFPFALSCQTLERAARGEASSPGGIAPVAMPPAAIAPAQRAQEDHHIHISPISVVAFFLLHGRDATGRKGTGCGVWLAVGFGCLHCCFGMPVCAAALAGLLACQCAQLLYPGRDRGGQRAAAAWHAADLMPYSRAREQAAAAQSELWLDADQPLGKPPSVIPMGAPQVVLHACKEVDQRCLLPGSRVRVCSARVARPARGRAAAPATCACATRDSSPRGVQAESPTHQEKAGPAILAPDAVGNGVRTDKTIVSVL